MFEGLLTSRSAGGNGEYVFALKAVAGRPEDEIDLRALKERLELDNPERAPAFSDGTGLIELAATREIAVAAYHRSLTERRPLDFPWTDSPRRPLTFDGSVAPYSADASV